MQKNPRRCAGGFSGVIAVIVVTSLAACQAAHHASEPLSAQNVIRVEVPASPAKTFDLAHEALAVILEGTTQDPRWLPTAAILSTRYMRRRSGPVITDVLVIAAIGRQIADTLHPKTLVEVSAWTVETPVGRTQFGASATTTTAPPRPRPLSRAETSDWAYVDRVVQYLVESGGKRLP